MRGQLPIWREDAGGLARFEDAGDGVFNRGLHLRVCGIAYMAHGGREVRRANEHAIHTGRGGNRVEVVQGPERLDLHDQTDLFVGTLEVVREMTPARSPGPGHAAHAALAVVLGVTHGLHQLRGLLGGFDHGHQDVLCAEVQVLFDERGLTHRHSGHRVADRVSGQGLQLGLDGAQVIGRVFAINDQPIEPGQGTDFGGVGTGQAHPQTDLGLLVLQGFFEKIHRGVHGTFPCFKGMKACRLLGTGWRLGRCGKAKRL